MTIQAEADLNVTKGKVTKLTADLQAVRKAHTRAADEMRALQQTRGQQEAGVQALVEQCDAEEDRVFARFSKGLKLGSVREYEQKQLLQEKEKELQALELKTQVRAAAPPRRRAAAPPHRRRNAAPPRRNAAPRRSPPPPSRLCRCVQFDKIGSKLKFEQKKDLKGAPSSARLQCP